MGAITLGLRRKKFEDDFAAFRYLMEHTEMYVFIVKERL